MIQNSLREPPTNVTSEATYRTGLPSHEEMARDSSCIEIALTRGKYKMLGIHLHEPARQHARALAQTSAFEISQRARKKVEALFAELKN